jgi:hypothetical protein
MSGDTSERHVTVSRMDPKAQSLLHHFVDLLGREAGVTYFREGGFTETVREVHEVLTRFSPEEGVIELERHGEPVRLRFHEPDLLKLLQTAEADKTHVWGEGLSDEEAAARWLAVYLDESVETQQADPSGWWVYEDHGFEPLRRWEAAARRLQRRQQERRRHMGLSD